MLLTKLVRAIDHPYLKGKGGRLLNNKRMQVNKFNGAFPVKTKCRIETQGTDMKSLKHHVGIQPLFVIFGSAVIFVTSYVSLVKCVGGDCAIVCQAVWKCTHGHDINWVKTKDLEV